ncbi:type II CAAX endopeptidase family protein [Gleimia hominis]|uniref:Type II CAAX endopeptidase family protein n=1 Tax=Gleimia hominis TaxID=595468 RepID=A0ABU3ICH8_9ACTO|nr:type II CAAX endopeptidase family protein [Gleimia hominis]MDT3768077.1 type II CAAX endopeptidase family protein [Gleimia hominis]
MLYLPRSTPSTPAAYNQVGAGPDRRWWRPLLGLALGIALFAVSSILVALVAAIANPNMFSTFTNGDINLTNPSEMIYMMTSLIILIPCVIVATIVGLRIRPGYLFSVAGRIRWRWLLTCVSICLVVQVPFIVGSAVLFEDVEWHPAKTLVLSLVLALVLSPLQSAAEEVTFRGYLLQLVGAWIPNRVVAFVMATVLSAIVFALAHGSLDPGVLATLAAMAAFNCYLTQRTGGLEAAIAQHAGNNTVIFTMEVFAGQTNSIIGEETTQGLIPTLFAIGVDLLIMVLILWAFRHSKLSAFTDPSNRPQPTLDYLYTRYQKGEFIDEFSHLYPPQVPEKAASN